MKITLLSVRFVLLLFPLVTGATAAAITHSITVTQPDHGTITPGGAVNVVDGKKQSFTIVPKPGFSILSLSVDGVPATFKKSGLNGIYTFNKVTADHSITATFKDTKKPNVPVWLKATAVSSSKIYLSWKG